jgi:hypothetical protein
MTVLTLIITSITMHPVWATSKKSLVAMKYAGNQFADIHKCGKAVLFTA